MRVQLRTIKHRPRSQYDQPAIPVELGNDLVQLTFITSLADAAQLKAGQLLHISTEGEK